MVGNSIYSSYFEGRTFDGALRWRHLDVKVFRYRIKEADKAYNPPKTKKASEPAAGGKKGEAQLTITVIAEN